MGPGSLKHVFFVWNQVSLLCYVNGCSLAWRHNPKTYLKWWEIILKEEYHECHFWWQRPDYIMIFHCSSTLNILCTSIWSSLVNETLETSWCTWWHCTWWRRAHVTSSWCRHHVFPHIIVGIVWKSGTQPHNQWPSHIHGAWKMPIICVQRTLKNWAGQYPPQTHPSQPVTGRPSHWTLHPLHSLATWQGLPT